MKAWIAFWNILTKDMKLYYLKPPNISWGIIFPIAWTLMFYIKSHTPMDIRTLLPGVMAMSILFGTTSLLSVTITFERKKRSFERLLLAPLSLNLLLLAKTTGAIIFGIINSFIPVLFAAFMIDLSGVNWFAVLANVFLLSVVLTFLGLFVSVSVSEVFEAQTFSNFYRFPMIFLCGLFFPIANLPVYIRPLSYAFPLTYGVDVLKTTFKAGGFMPLSLDFLALIGFALALFALSVRGIKKTWIQ